jgi:hypothetical protein
MVPDSETTATAVAPTAKPIGGLPLSEKKQQFSLAYVGIVVAAAGCWVKHHATDYDGVDITIASSANYETYYGPEFEIQVKCTSRSDLLRADHLAWEMEAGPYTKLINPKRFLPAYLGVLLVPGDDPDAWLDQDEHRLITESRMYWQRARELEELKPGQVNKTVQLPRTNLFDVAHLLDIMRTIGEGGVA